jgi:DNA replication protein DnaC
VKTTEPNDGENFLEREKRKQAELKASIEAFVASQPVDRPCNLHPQEKEQFLPWPTRSKCNEFHYDGPGGWKPVYGSCPQCEEAEMQGWLCSAGVPAVNLHCSLENWTPGDEAEKQHLAGCKTFAEEVRKGFMVLLGPVGTGKTHLAVGIMRGWEGSKSVFVKQSTLLRQLRATYGDKSAADPIPKCQSAGILVLDEMGLSGGGKDELPMLSEILDHRYGAKKPTILTSNCAWDELREILGPRLADRLKEAAFKVLVFSGESHRAEQRDNYFKEPTAKPKTQWIW